MDPAEIGLLPARQLPDARDANEVERHEATNRVTCNIHYLNLRNTAQRDMNAQSQVPFMVVVEVRMRVCMCVCVFVRVNVGICGCG